MPTIRKEKQDEPAVFGTEEALARGYQEFMNPTHEKIFTLSDVTPEEIFGIAYLEQMATLFKSEITHDWNKKFLLLRISRFRLGRKEGLMMSTGIREAETEKRKGRKLTDLFAGLK
jgi:hypothetical protein